MCLLPFSLLPPPFFSHYISLSFSLSELAQCANVSTLPFICQSPEQRPAPSVYLCLHSAAPSALLSSPSPIPLFKKILPSLHPTSFSSPLFHLNLLFLSLPASLPPFPIPFCCSVAFLSFTSPLCHPTSIFYTILASPIHSPSPSAPPLVHGSWHFTGVTSWHFQSCLQLAHQVFWIKSTAPPPPPPSSSSTPPVLRFASILRHERVRSRLAPSDHKTPCPSLHPPRLSPLALLLLFFFFFYRFPLPMSPSFSLSHSIRHSIRLWSPRWLMWLAPALQSRGRRGVIRERLEMDEGVASHRLSVIKKCAWWRRGVGCQCSLYSHIGHIWCATYFGRKMWRRRQCSSYTRHVFIYRYTFLIAVQTDKWGCHRCPNLDTMEEPCMSKIQLLVFSSCHRCEIWIKM